MPNQEMISNQLVAKTLSEIAAMPALLTVEQAAEILQIPVSTVYDLAARGVIPRVKLGKTVRIPKARLMEATLLADNRPIPYEVVKDRDSQHVTQ